MGSSTTFGQGPDTQPFQARLDTHEPWEEIGCQEWRRHECVGTTTSRTSSAERSCRTRFRILVMESPDTRSRAHSHRHREKDCLPRRSTPVGSAEPGHRLSARVSRGKVRAAEYQARGRPRSGYCVHFDHECPRIWSVPRRAVTWRNRGRVLSNKAQAPRYRPTRSPQSG